MAAPDQEKLRGCNSHNDWQCQRGSPWLDYREWWRWSEEHDQIDEKPRVLLNTIRRRKEQRRRRLKAVISIRGQYQLFS